MLTYDLLEGNPGRTEVSQCLVAKSCVRTSLHSVFVRRLYFSGFSFLHLLQTRHPKTFL